MLFSYCPLSVHRSLWLLSRFTLPVPFIANWQFCQFCQLWQFCQLRHCCLLFSHTLDIHIYIYTVGLILDHIHTVWSSSSSVGYDCHRYLLLIPLLDISNVLITLIIHDRSLHFVRYLSITTHILFVFFFVFFLVVCTGSLLQYAVDWLIASCC
jgi:hypothetical protein